MKHLRFLLVPVLAVSMALPAAAEKISLKEISNYFNSFSTAQSRFSQVNADGSKSSGNMFMQRPGRARFEYDKPDDTLVIAGGSQVAIFDQKSNTGPEQYPLNRTPLSIILAKNVNLGGAKMVVGHGTRGTDTVVRAQDPKNPEYGSIDLIFEANPTRLIEWIINDAAGNAGTRVIFGDFKTGVSLPASLFNITLASRER
ncbi:MULTISPECIES: LolA family protein [Falsihalocynthiibacter]|uniref:LolA family protein n=1 Tax=Falsihalocynthiibacter TaxID=2854182 RepID=UPI003001B9EA